MIAMKLIPICIKVNSGLISGSLKWCIKKKSANNRIEKTIIIRIIENCLCLNTTIFWIKIDNIYLINISKVLTISICAWW